jgi:hypothetical protein
MRRQCLRGNISRKILNLCAVEAIAAAVVVVVVQVYVRLVQMIHPSAHSPTVLLRKAQIRMFCRT